MKYWNQFPLFRLILPFIFGIITALLINSEIHIPILIFVSLLIFVLIFAFYSNRLVNYRNRWLFGIIIYVLLYLFGFELCIDTTPKFKHNYFGNFTKANSIVISEVTEPIVVKAKSYKAIVKVIYVKDSNKWVGTSGKAIIYFQKDSLSSQVHYGDRLLMNIRFDMVKTPQNPDEFNYKRYLSNKGIYQQAYVKSGTWYLLSSNNGNKLIAYSIGLRNRLLHILKQNKVTGDEYAVASAMLLGHSDFLDSDLRREYSKAGAIHILCVSGLHVGIIYLVLNYLLFFLDKIKYGKYLKTMILISLIWFYALITGLSPSVMRASTMISFVIVGYAIKRYTNIYNTIAASAFLLIIINPYIITEIGFQLSYSAVIGIVMLQQPMYKLWITKNWFLDKIWALMTVSVTAQIGTLPIAVFYFHQFPNYFILTNLIVIPLSSLIIYSGILVFLTSPFALLSAFFSKILVGLIFVLNYSVRFIENLPFSTTNRISINYVDMFFLYGIIASLVVFFLLKNKVFFKYALLSLIFLLISFSVKNIEHTKQRKFIVYNISKASVYDFIDGKKDYLFADSLLLKNRKKQLFHINNYWIKSQIKRNVLVDLNDSQMDSILNEDKKILDKKNDFIQFYDKRIAVVNNEFKSLKIHKKIKIDFLIIADNARVKVSDLLSEFNIGQIIIDSSNSYWKSNKLIGDCKELGIKCYSVLQSGAFVAEL